jgi:hypothetical protein
MLLLNGEQFIPTGKNPEHALQIRHYEEAITYLRNRYGQGGRNRTLVLTRRKEQKRNEGGLLEETPPMVFPAQAVPEIQLAEKDKSKGDKVGGMETWAYSAQQPRRRALGEPYEPIPKSIKFMSHFETFDLMSDIELIYFLLYKSPRVYYPPAVAQGKVKKGDLMVEDKALIAKEKVQKQRDELKLKNAILAPDIQYPLHNDTNLRKVAAAWGIDGAMDEHTSVDDLRIRLEHSVTEAEKNKAITGSGKGLDEFFELINFDDAVNQRSLIMYALDTGKLIYDTAKVRYSYASGTDLLDVPDGRKYEAFDYLAGYLGNEINKRSWEAFTREVVDEEYIKTLTFADLKWLAKMNELPVSQKSTEALVEDLCKVYCG